MFLNKEKMDIQIIINEFDSTIQTLVSDFKTLDPKYFFTEKEIHAYFYSLCLKNKKFEHAGYNLVHTEYPTPFKCDTSKYPSIVEASLTSKKMRAHIDMVLINPNFIDWVIKVKKKHSHKYISGLTNDLFSKYIVEFYEVYQEFYNTCHEPILLYALEFKYFRHNYIGTVLPIKELNYDINKLKLLDVFPNSQSHQPNNLNAKFNFRFGSKEIKVIAFVNQASKNIGKAIQSNFRNTIVEFV